MGERCKIIGW